MTDFDRFKALYESLGIPFEKSNKPVTREYPEIEGAFKVVLEAQEHEKLEGYYDFKTEIIFDKNGNFYKQGFWE